MITLKQLSDVIELINRNKIKDAEWDKLVETGPSGNVYSLSWYMDTVAENWMVARDKSGKNAFLIPFKSKAGVRLVYQPFFSREIFCSLKDKYTPADIIKLLPGSFRQIEFSLRDIRDIDPMRFKIEKCKHQVLDISRKYETIAKGYSENATRLIKKAKKGGLNVIESENIEPIIELFRKSKGAELKTLKVKDYNTLRRLMKKGIEKETGKCYHVVDTDNKIIAAVYFFDWKDKLIYLKGSANETGRKSGAMYMAFDDLIKKYAGKKRELDFGGSRIPNVAAFYKKFGAADSEYYFIKLQNLPVYFKWLKAAKKMMGK